MLKIHQLLILCLWASRSWANPERAGMDFWGAYMRVFYYYAYRMDQEKNGGVSVDIAPGCIQCNFSTFFSYIDLNHQVPPITDFLLAGSPSNYSQYPDPDWLAFQLADTNSTGPNNYGWLAPWTGPRDEDGAFRGAVSVVGGLRSATNVTEATRHGVETATTALFRLKKVALLEGFAKYLTDKYGASYVSHGYISASPNWPKEGPFMVPILNVTETQALLRTYQADSRLGGIAPGLVSTYPVTSCEYECSYAPTDQCIQWCTVIHGRTLRSQAAYTIAYDLNLFQSTGNGIGYYLQLDLQRAYSASLMVNGVSY
ncbi:hypothetical protein PG984_010583 [Apiospora sp. TS-2023a]